MERDLLIDTLDKGAYPLAYDGVTDPNPDPGFDAGKFAKGDFVAVEAQIGTWDFEKDGKRIKRYVLKMQSLYLVKDPRPKDPISKPQKPVASGQLLRTVILTEFRLARSPFSNIK